MDNDTPIGQRIRHYRTRLGLSQATLAGLVDRSESWLQKVESGDLVMDSMSVLIALANVLKVGTWDLQPKLGLPPNGGAPLDPPKGIHGIRRAVLADPHAGPDRAPPSERELSAAVEQVKHLNWDGSYEAVAHALPQVLAVGRAAVEHEVPGGWSGLAGAYSEASGLARVFGETDLACAIADKSISTALRSGDDLLVTVARLRLAMALMAAGWLDAAASVCSDAADEIAPTKDTGPEGWSVWGSVHFVGASAAVRMTPRRMGDARRLLRDARAAADRVGPGRNDYWQAFGPASVTANEVGLALESGDLTGALRAAEHADIDEMPGKWRRSRFLLDVAQAYGLRKDDAAAVNALLQAEEHSPETVRYSVIAHQLVRACLKREQRHRTPQLRGLAERLDVTI